MTETKKTVGPRHRSPNFPSIKLEDAVTVVSGIFAEYKRHAVPMESIHSKWGVEPYGSAGNRRIAALKAYGLIEHSGAGKKRKVSVSELGERIVRNAPDRDALLQEAALTPPIFQELIDKFPDLPPDDLLKQYLLWDRSPIRFNEDAVDLVIDNFKGAVSFAKLASCDIIDDGHRGHDNSPVKVGDFVQWTSQGKAQFTEAQRVVEISDDGEWAFVEGSETGVPLTELTADDRNPATHVNAPPINPHFRRDMNIKGGPLLDITLPSGTRVFVCADKLLDKDEWANIKPVVQFTLNGSIGNGKPSGAAEGEGSQTSGAIAP